MSPSGPSSPRPSSPAPRLKAKAPRPAAVLLATAAVVLSSFAAAALALRTHADQRATERARVARGVQGAQAAVRAWETQSLARATAWAADPAVVAAGLSLPPTLASLARSAANDGVRAVALFAPDGTLAASTAPTLLSDASLGQRIAAVQRARLGTPSVAGPVWPTRTRDAGAAGEWLLVSAAPVHAADGSVQAVLAVLHAADAPLRAVRPALRADASSDAYLVHEDGEVLAAPGEGVRAPVARNAPLRRAAIPATPEGETLRPFEGANGRSVVAAWATAEPLAARVVYEHDAAAVAALPVVSRAQLAAAGFAAAGLLAAWLGLMLVRSCRGARAGDEEASVVVESAPNAVLVTDARGTITRANARAAALLAAPVDALVGSPLDQWLMASAVLRPERFTGWLEAAARDGLARRPDGEQVPVEVRLGRGELAGGAVHVVVLLDRAEQRGAARALTEARTEATRARERQAELVSVMHQEIRTPMSRVLGMVHLLKDTSLSTVQQGYVDSLMRSAQLMMTFVTDVLDLAKLEQGTLQLIEAPFEVRPMLEEVGQLCATQAEASGTLLETRVTDRTPEWLVGDAGRLRQVLINLIGNGIKFAPSGQVTVRVDGEPAGTEVSLQVRVSDNGPGMDVETVRRLFAKDPTTVSRLAGAGIGLSMAKHLVDLMGGRLEVQSTQGEGSTFHFRVRLRNTESMSGPDARERARLAGARALVVDRSEQELSVTREWLRSWGMRVEVTRTPEEAIGHLRRAAAEGDPVEVALVDRMTVGDQADAFARRLRAEPAIAGTGLLVSSNGASGGEDRLAAAGCDAVISKPFAAGALSRTLAKVVERPRAERGRGELIRGDALASAPRPAAERPDGHIHVVEEPSAPRRALAEPVEDTRIRVLLAEDNRVNQIIATNLLQRLGCRVEVVRDGTEAVRLASRQEFDVILMDIQMPHLDGLRATTLIRRLPPPFNGAHIIAMGTSASPDEHDRYLAAGMNDVVVKPLTPEAVQSALERRPAGLERATG